MSTRTPPLQLRSQFGRDWGNYANGVISLPNQSSNVLNAAQHPVLEAGDRAFATSRVWECLDPGTAGGGDALWRPVGPDILDTVEGFSLANYYEAPAAIAEGSGLFSAVWYGYLIDFVDGAGQFLMGHTSGAFDGGWGMIIGGRTGGGDVNVPEAFVVETGPSIVGLAESVPQGSTWQRSKPNHIAIAYEEAAELALWIDGVRSQFSPETSLAAFLPSPGGRFKVGLGGIFGNEPALNLGFIGGGYIDGLALTASDVQEHLQACRDAGFAFVEGALTWTHRWDVRTAQALGGIATLPDLGAGGGDLTAVGTPVFRARRV